MLLLTLAAIVAQAVPSSPDVISGGAGWAGAGLLGLVLGWLLFVHLPAKDKQIAELVKSRDDMVKELTGSFREGIVESEKRATEVDRERREDYRISLAMVVSHCEKEMSGTSAAIRRDLDELNAALAEFRSLMKELRDRKGGGQS
jgi:hypothetical protein